jgi:hypothetical protein
VSGPGWGSNKFGPSYNWVAIETLNDQLYLDGNLPYGNAGSGAEAVCVDTTYGGGEGWVDGPYTQNLADNEGGGWACGLVSVEGFFDGYNYDGPTVTYDAAAMRWRLTFYDNQEGVATCVW